MSPRTAIITRFHYAKDHKDFPWRLAYYIDEVLPRLQAQTDQDFDIWIWCEDHHADLLKSLWGKIHTFNGTYEKRDSHLFIDYTAYENITGLPEYEIQIGLDSDDLVRPQFIETIHRLCTGEEKTLISFQPQKYDIKTGRKYIMDQYTIERGSPIFAFYQPECKDFKFAYHTSHLRMPKLAEKVVLVPEGMVFMAVHDLNDSTKIKARDKLCN